LELQAFGAFPGRVEVDLDVLGESGLVLLTGDTGGGKTTLLDAIGFALYGVVPGERAKAKGDLRSHHAVDADPTWVRLTFTSRGQRLRIHRTPEWQRAKARGTGTVREQPTALLERWDGAAWSPVAQRLDDVGLEVGRLLGMDAGQFFQVVLLPQGRFAAFLQAEHKEREKLLKQLFHVDRFESVERWLADRAARAAADVDAARAELDRIGSRVAQEADLELPDNPLLDWAARLAAAAAAEREAASLRAAELVGSRRAAEASLRAADRLADRQARRRAAEQEQQHLVGEQPAVDLLAAELSAAERARPVVVAARAVAARQEERARAQAAAHRARADLVELGQPVGDDADELRARAPHGRVELGRLQGLRDVARRQLEAETAAGVALREADRLAGQVAQRADRLLALPGQRAAAELAVSQAELADRAVPAAAQALAAAQERADLTARLAEARSQAASAANEVTRVEAEADRLREQADKLRNRRFEAMVAELADALVDGTPCPVCGSIDHPDVVEFGRDDVTRDDERVAGQAAQRAAAVARDAGRALAGLQERVALLQEAAGNGPSDPTEAARTAAALSVLKSQAARLPAARAALDRLRQEAGQLEVELARLEVQEREAHKRGAEADAQAVDLRRCLDAELGPGVDLEDRLSTVERHVAAQELAARAFELLTEATARQADAERDALEQAQAAGFADLASARSAQRPPERLTAALARVEAHREALAGVRQSLASEELAVALEPAAPVERARAALRAAEQVCDDAASVLSLVADRADRLAALAPSWEGAWAALPPLVADATAVRSLADLAAGKGANRLSMPLSSFVLAARLEEVAEAASLRLLRMSGERYTLVHTDVTRDRRSRAGLGLQVADGWTGRTRDTATLSGGETFMTALALALGLADVVTAEAGGQTIDALFVDEGFGTLDADSLDAVMDVLDDLRSGGRLVGVVSHVADLRTRIPAQVQVLKGTAGSTVRSTVG